MFEEIIDNTKRMLNIPIEKPAKDLYIVIDKATGKKVLDSSRRPFIIQKYQIEKLDDKYTVIPMVEDMKKIYESKLELQNKLKYGKYPPEIYDDIRIIKK